MSFEPGGAEPVHGDLHALAARVAGAAGTSVVELRGPQSLAAVDGGVALCADVLEGEDAAAATAALRDAVARAEAVVAATPERELARGIEHLGPPPAAGHSAELALRELRRLLVDAGFEHLELGLARGASGRTDTAVALLCRDAARLERASAAAAWLRPALPERLAGRTAPLVAPFAAGRITRRVCFISRQYCSDVFFAGIGRAVLMAARALTAAGAEVHVITVAPRNARLDVVMDGIDVHRIPDPIGYGAPLHTRALAWADAAAARYAELDAAIGFDVVEVPDYHAEGLSLRLRPDTALVTTLHGSWAVMGVVNQHEAPGPDVDAFCGLELGALRRSDLVLAPTRLLLDATREVAAIPEPAAVLPHAFDASGFPARAPRTERPDVLRLAFLGRLERRKGPDLAVLAAAAAQRRGRRVELRLIGASYDEFAADAVRSLVREHGVEGVTFERAVAPEQIAEVLRDVDCAVLPSRLENFHFAAVEALAVGVPVITTDRCGLTQWFGPEDGLAAVALDTAEGFAEAAADRLLDDAWLRDAGARAPGRVRDVLAPERLGPELLDVYDAAISRTRPAKVAVALADAEAEGPRLAERRRQAAKGLDTRRFVTLASAEELLERADLLAAYAAAMRDTDDATLLVTSRAPAARSAPAVLELLAALGLDDEAGPDMVLSGGVTDGGALLLPLVDAVLSERPQPAVLADRPSFGRSSAPALAALAAGPAAAPGFVLTSAARPRITVLLADLDIGGVPRLYVDLLGQLVREGVACRIVAPDGVRRAEAQARGIAWEPIDWARGDARGRLVPGEHTVVVADPRLLPSLPAAIENGPAALAVHTALPRMSGWFSAAGLEELRAGVHDAVTAGRLGVLTIGEKYVDAYSAFFGLARDAATLLPPAVDAAAIGFDPAPRPLDTVLTVARMSPEKSAHVESGIALVAARLAAGRPSHLDVVGDGPWRRAAERLCAAALPAGTWTFHGASADPGPAIAAAGVVLGTGLTALEAACAGARVAIVRTAVDRRGPLGPVLAPETYDLVAADSFGARTLDPSSPAEVWAALEALTSEQLRILRGRVEHGHSLAAAAAVLAGALTTPAPGSTLEACPAIPRPKS
jgi:glycosyltransferase involved in cell wall biosynthesis